MSFMSTRRSAKPVKKRLGSIQEELQKSFPAADTLPEKTPDHLEPENAAQKLHSETFAMNYRGQSKRHPICRGKLLSAHQGGAGRRCYGATCLTWNRSIGIAPASLTGKSFENSLLSVFVQNSLTSTVCLFMSCFKFSLNSADISKICCSPSLAGFVFWNKVWIYAFIHAACSLVLLVAAG